ncbi:MAG: hypothetical protein LBP55_03725 [Candidatus Adiutrix sp.]|nr:hypothetical protein [Candidatus Adiutrix sp.]
MTDPVAGPAPPQPAQLRCPNCSSMVTLPAEVCPRCGFNLRTGLPAAPEDDESDRRALRFKVALASLVLALIIALAVVFLGGFLDKKPQPGQANTLQPKDGPAGALDAFQGLSDRPLGLQPGPILDRTRNTASQLENRQRGENDQADHDQANNEQP